MTPFCQVSPFKVIVAFVPVVKIPPVNNGFTKVATAELAVVIT